MGYKSVQQEASVSDAVSIAFSYLEDLAGECREVVDNASENLANTQRIQTLGETADALESFSEPEVPEVFESHRVKFTEQQKRNPSRASRCGNAVAALQAVVDACEERIQELEKILADPEYVVTPGREAEHEALETLRDACQEAIDAAEACEFPGMYG